MSGQGFRSQLNSSTADTGIKGPQRDAWNQPIKEPAQRTAGNTGDPDPNDDTINDKDIDNIWSDIKKKIDPNAPDPTKIVAPVEPAKVVSPSDQLKNYLNEAGLGEFTLSDTDKEKIAAGDFADFNSKILGLIQTAHVKALSGAQTLVKAEVAKAVADLKNDTRSFVSGKEALEALNRALPFTKDPAIGPIAQTVMQRFLERGASTEDAIKGVQMWAKKFVSLADPGRQVNSNRNGNFQGSPDQNEETANWMDILSGKGS